VVYKKVKPANNHFVAVNDDDNNNINNNINNTCSCTQLHAQAAGALDSMTICSHGRYATPRSKLLVRSFPKTTKDDVCGKVSLY
jgi:hypothetical protein